MENEKIHAEIDLVIKQRVAALANHNNLSRPTTTKLENWLLGMEHRTYLWLHLAIESIEEHYKDSLWPDSESIESLELPSSIDDAYEKLLGRIKAKQRSKAMVILHIIIGARRPLTISEMTVALSLADHPNSQSYAEFKVKMSKGRVEKLVRRLCGLFVFLNHSRIYLIHQTAKDFLIQRSASSANGCWKYCLKPDDSERILACICIDYLCLTDIDNIPVIPSREDGNSGYPTLKNSRSSKREEDIDDKPSIEVFLHYSAEHWPSHFRDSTICNGSLTVEKVYSLYQLERYRFKTWFPLFWRAKSPNDYHIPDMNDIRLASYNGHGKVLQFLLKNKSVNIEAKDKNGYTAVIWAVNQGYEEVVKMLLDNQADITAQGRYDTALQLASREGHETVVKLLLDSQVDVNAQG